MITIKSLIDAAVTITFSYIVLRIFALHLKPDMLGYRFWAVS